MSFISGSNSLTPAIAGAFDLRAVIVEKDLFSETIGRDLEVCGEFDFVFVGGLLLLKQRQKYFC